jgi:DNA-binding response OmpR family regulator
VIDDDDSIRDIAVTMLKRLGYKTMAASNGATALEMATRFRDRLDLAMLDIELPDMNGDELYHHLMKTCPDLKVIVCSGYSVEGHGEEVMKSGAQIFMQKPFSFSELAANMRKLIERRKNRRFTVNEGKALFEVPPLHHITELFDISLKGAALRQPDEFNVTVEGWNNLSIFSSHNGIEVTDIPFRFLSENPGLPENRPSLMKTGRLHLKFGDMPLEKCRQIEEFIERCAVAH